MPELLRGACRFDRTIIVTFLVALAASFSISIWYLQGSLRKNAFVAFALENPSNVTVHFIDVGQGDSIFIDTPNKDVLIDGGPTNAGSTVLGYLGNLSITHIHLMVATHPHEDHIGGLVAVLSSTTTVDEVLINNQTFTSGTYTNFMNLAKSHKITVAQRGQTFILTETSNLTVFNPVQPMEFSNVNDNSIVVKLQVGNTSFLFTGDAEAEAEQSMIDASLDLKSDVLKIGHHGSRTSTTQSFLDSVSPLYAVISAGKNNPYGYPHQEIMQRLLAKGAIIYGTYHSGTIIASTDGMSIVFLGNPEPIPEFHPCIILPLLVTGTLLIAISYKKQETS